MPVERERQWLKSLEVGLFCFGVGSGVGLSSCASYTGTARTIEPNTVAREVGWLRVTGVPVIRQEHASDCGAAALASVLRHWGIDVEPGQIEAKLRASEQAESPGLLAGDLRDYVRSIGLSAYLFEGSFDDLRHELTAGRPVIVGIHQRLSSGDTLAHYEVVVGHHPAEQRVLTMDPAHGLRQDSVGGFASEWRGSHQLMLVVFPPARTSARQ